MLRWPRRLRRRGWWVPGLSRSWSRGLGSISHSPQLRLRPESVTEPEEAGSGWLLSEWAGGRGWTVAASTSWYTVQNKHPSWPQLTPGALTPEWDDEWDLSLLLAELLAHGSDHFIKKFWWLRGTQYPKQNTHRLFSSSLSNLNLRTSFRKLA